MSQTTAPKHEAKEKVKADKKANKPYVTQPKKAISAWLYYNVATVSVLKAADGLSQKEAFI